MLGFDAYSIRNLVTTTSESGTTFSVTILFLIFFCLSFFPYYFIGAKKMFLKRVEKLLLQ